MTSAQFPPGDGQYESEPDGPSGAVLSMMRAGHSMLAPLVIVGAIVMAVAAWWAWPSGEAPRALELPGPAVAGSSAVGEAPAELEKPLARGRSAAEEARDAGSAGSGGAPLAGWNGAPPMALEGKLIIRVLGHDRAPVEGVEIEWWLVNGEGELRKASSQRPSDARGLVVVNQPDRFLDAVFHPERAHPSVGASMARIGLAPTLPLDELSGGAAAEAPYVLWFDEEPVRGVPMDLVLPPTGAVRVTWDDIDGGLGAQVHPGQVILRRADAPSSSGWRRVVRGGLREGEVVISPVGLGWQVAAELWVPELAIPTSQAEAAGPTAADQTATVHVARPRGALDLVHVRGVVLDSSGAPIHSGELVLRFGAKGRSPHLEARTSSDELGHFSIEAPGESAFGVLHIEDRSRKPNRAGETALHELHLAETVLEVGEVALHLPEGATPWLALVSGQVVDAAGVPLTGRGTRVSVEARARSLDDKPKEPERWVRVATAKVDSEGRFAAEARVELSDQLLRVTPYDADYRRIGFIEVPVGTQGLALVLERGHAVRLTVDVDPWAAVSEAVTLRFTGHGRDHKPSLMDFAGHYGGSFSGLEPGTYRLEARMHGGDWVLAEREVEVYGDVDLGTIDLRGTLGVCHLTVLDGSGAPLSKGWVGVRDVATQVSISTSVKVEEHGHVTLVVPLSVDEVLLLRQDAGRVRVTSDWFIEPTLEQLLRKNHQFQRHEVTLRR